MATSRAQPSRRYRDLLDLYRRMHVEGDAASGRPPEQTFSGGTLRLRLEEIRDLIRRTRSRTLLDYGSGKGLIHNMRPLDIADGPKAPSLAAYWSIDPPRLYDPAYLPYAERPGETFDMVICTDVLEHCPEEDIHWILADIFSFARRVVYLVIACYPALKSLPDGENAHVTVRPPAWWLERIGQAAALRPLVAWGAEIDEFENERPVLRFYEGKTATG